MAIVRGATIFFKNIEFYDEEDVVFVASAATLHLNYPLGNSFEEADVTLTLAGGKWSGSWDSGIADPGVVEGHMEGTNGTIIAAKDFKFKLTANRANERDETDA